MWANVPDMLEGNGYGSIGCFWCEHLFYGWVSTVQIYETFFDQHCGPWVPDRGAVFGSSFLGHPVSLTL